MSQSIRLLILEDRDSDVALLLRAIRQSGYDVDWQAVDTEGDFRVQLENSWDIILSDYKMPTFDGLEALHILKDSGKNIPFIIVTGAVSEEVAVECIKQGATDYLLKDRLTRIGEAIKHALNERELHLKKQQAEQAEQEQRIFAEALYDTISAVANTLDFDRVMDLILENVGRVVPHQASVIALYTEDKQHLLYRYWRGFSEIPSFFKETVPVDRFPSYQYTLETGSMILYSHVRPEDKWVSLPEFSWIRSYLVTPLNVEGEIVGFLSLHDAMLGQFDINHAKRLEAFATQAAIAIANARLHRTVQRQLQDLTILNRATELLFTPWDNTSLSNLCEQIVLGVAVGYKVDCELSLKIADRLTPIASAKKQLNDASKSDQPNPRFIIPLYVGAREIGALNIEGFDNYTFSQNQHLLEMFSERAAVMIEHLQFYHQLQGYANELEERVIERTAELQQAKDEAETILNSSSDALALTDINGMIQKTNEAFDGTLGYDITNQMSFPLRKIIHSDHQKIFKDALEALHESGQDQRIEASIIRSDDSTFDADIALAITPGERTPNIVCSIRDISHRKQIERELLQNLEKEKELNYLKSRFVSTVSHEFRTPLAIIQTSTGLLRKYFERMEAQERIKYLGRIEQQIVHMTDLLEDVLLIEKIAAGTAKFEREIVDVGQLCLNIVEDFRSISQDTHVLEYSVSGSMVNCSIVSAKLMRQIIINLVSNAIKYTPKGGIVQIELHADQEEILLSVGDNGIGIPLTDQAHIFEAFHRALNAETISGTGLGLMITKSAVDLHGGEIDFESNEGVGTTFKIVIPQEKQYVSSLSD